MDIILFIPAILAALANPHSSNDISNAYDPFNAYNAETFADSTCQVLPLEKPAGFFTSPSGSPTASGSRSDPLDLSTALGKQSPLKAGDTLWLMEGKYIGSFTSYLKGEEGNPIEVRPVPGKHVILETPARNPGDSRHATLFIDAPWTNYYGLEIRSTGFDRFDENQDGSGIDVQGGVSIGAYHNSSNTKIINFIVHDTSGGLSSFSASTNSELYGNIIYNNGWEGRRGSGHAIYTQNTGPYKKLTNNIIFFGFGTGIHAYVEGSSKLANYDIQGNTWFLTGASDTRATQKKDNCLVGGFHPVTNLLIKNNLGYSDNGRGTRVGYSGDVTGQSAVLEDNYLDENLWVAGNWDKLDVSNTTILHGITGESQSQINNLGGNKFKEQNDLPSGKKIFVSKNAYDPRRARIVIYNYDESNTVSVDADSVLKTGEAYRVHSVFDLFSSPVITGIYDGKSIQIPMGTVAPPQPTKHQGIDPIEDDPKKRFGVFILTHAGCQ